VFALAPHGDRHTLAEEHVRVLPAGLSATRATLAANLETAITCVWDAEVSLGDEVFVFGGGIVGILTAWLLVRAGTSVTLIESQESRRRAALALLPSSRVLASLTDSSETADVLIEATGDPRVLDEAIAHARQESRIVLASFYGSRRATLDLGSVFHRKRLELRASQVSAIPARLCARWTFSRRWDLVLALLQDSRLDALFAPVTSFEHAAELYARLDREADVPPQQVFVY
jgi:threonine dehydrogenase-like Zn-dependent dehydrogenase